MKTKYILIALNIAVLFSACKQADLSFNTNVAVPVSVIEVNTSSIEEFINTTSTVYPMKEVSLKSEMSGKYILQTNPNTGKLYALGDKVSKGAAVIKFEDAEYYNNLRIKSKQVEHEISKQEFEKQQSLYEKGGATLRELKNAEIKLINAEYDIESSRINLAKMSIVSLFNGVITNLPYFTQGVKIDNNTEVLSMVNYNDLYLEINLPEKYYGHVERGLKVYVTSYTNTMDTLFGKVTQLSPSIDPDARTFKGFVEVDNHENKLLPGMFVKADLVINSSNETIVIPKDIIINRNRKQVVFIVDKGNAVERVLSTGLESTYSIEVLSGLSVGESVVSKGFETLRDKSKVQVLK